MKNNIPLISIITPTYNRKELLEKAILSVINQKKDISFEWELLIVDDWSIDWTKEYIQKYLDEYKYNINYFYQANSWVWKARNIGLNNMSEDSDYIIFLDSDDELKNNLISFFLKKIELLKKNNEFDKILWFYFLCEDENWNIIWNKKILNNIDLLKLWYKDYLIWKIWFELLILVKSSIFLNTKLRFDEEVVNESILRSKIWKYSFENNYAMILYNFIGRLYNIEHNWEIKITKTISNNRFLKNAIWNEKVLEIIWNDLLKYWYKINYSDLLFRAGINYLLYWDKYKWLNLLKKSLKYNKSLRNLLIYILSNISTKIILLIYKLYI